MPFNLFAAYQSESPLSCNEDVTNNLPGTLYLKKTFEKVAELMGRGITFLVFLSQSDCKDNE